MTSVTCGRIHAQKNGLQTGVWSSIMPSLAACLVLELNAGTVPLAPDPLYVEQ